MKITTCGIRYTWRLVAIASVCVGGFVSATSYAQAPSGVIQVSAEPEHRIRFDNGKVRMYEVLLSKGKSTLQHEHRADNFQVFFNTAAVINEPQGGKPMNFPINAGFVAFSSTANGPYTHRVEGGGDTPFRVIAIELLGASQAAAGVDSAKRPTPPFTVALENVRGRAYRFFLNPGESTGTFTRATNTAIFAISSGRISEVAEGKAPRLWDFDSGNFRWSETSEKLSLKNESSARIELVEIEIH